MELSKTIEEAVDVLLVDRTDEGTPEATQAFSKTQILDIQTNTLAHKEALEAEKESRAEEYTYFLSPGEGGKSLIDLALEEQGALIAECEKLNIIE
jgi:hypothetical protein